MEKISIKGRHFVDASGRQRIFNGVNLVHKGTPVEGQYRKDYFPVWPDDMFRQLAALGVNLVRFGLIWDAVEPQPDHYDDAYLAHMARYIDLCAENGIYVYLDMHQDLYAAAYSDGAPDWAVIHDGYPHKKTRFIWAESYFIDKATHRALDHFWANTPIRGKGLQEHFADMWCHVASFFADKPNIIGYDVFNEPLPGTDSGRIFRETIRHGIGVILSRKVPKLATLRKLKTEDFVPAILSAVDDPAVFRDLTSGGDMLNLKFCVDTYYPFLQSLALRLRAVAPDKIIIMENSYWSNTSMPWPIPYLREADGARMANVAFAPHGYDITVDSPYTNTAGNSRVQTIFDAHAKTQDRLDVPVIVGEWGGMVPGSEEYPHLEFLLKYFDDHQWSQTYWAFAPDFAESKIMQIIARPYPVAVNGEIERYGFDRDNSTFRLVYDCAFPRKGGKTIVWTPTEPRKVTGSRCTVEQQPDGSWQVSFLNNKGRNEIEVCL